jgi:two-component system response regulator ResD
MGSEQPIARVLVVDDDADTCMLITDVLEEDGYEVRTCSSAEEALGIFRQEKFDLILSDIRMPEVTGLDLLRRIRRGGSHTKVILMTAYASVQTAVQAIRGEAFDYLVKPFSLNELRLQVRQALEARASEQPRHDVIHYENLSIDHSARRVWLDGGEVVLTAKEFDVLAYLADQIGCAVSLTKLLQEVWICTEPDDRTIATVRSCVRRLRQKLGDDARNPRFIFSAWGVGYQLGK